MFLWYVAEQDGQGLNTIIPLKSLNRLPHYQWLDDEVSPIFTMNTVIG